MLIKPEELFKKEFHLTSRDIHVKVDRPDKYVAVIKVENQRMVIKASLIPDSLYDSRGIDHLKLTGLPLPIVVKELHGSPHVLVLTWQHGDALTMLSPHTAIVEAGQALRTIHSVPPTEFLEQREWRERFRELLIHELNWWLDNGGTKESADITLGYLNSFWGDMLHRGNHTVLGDARGEHFLTYNGHLSGIIDLGEVWVGDPVMDFANIAVHDPLLFFALLEGYNLSPDELSSIHRLMPLYVLYRRIATAHWSALFGKETDTHTYLSHINVTHPMDWYSRTYQKSTFDQQCRTVSKRARGHHVFKPVSIA